LCIVEHSVFLDDEIDCKVTKNIWNMQIFQAEICLQNEDFFCTDL
jgi:hypothetical protein